MTFPFEKQDEQSVSSSPVSVPVVNYYETLGLSYTASKHEIRQAYLCLKNTYSKQSCAIYSLMSDEEISSIMMDIDEAFKVLDNDILKKQYDEQLGIIQKEDVLPELVHKEQSRVLVETKTTINEDRPEQVYANVNQTRPSTDVFHCKKSKDENAQKRISEILTEQDIGDGSTYRSLREALDVSLDEIQDKTKISIEYVKCIENNCFERLPQVIFVKGFLRGYFKYLDIPDYENLVSAFITRFEDCQKDPKKS